MRYKEDKAAERSSKLGQSGVKTQSGNAGKKKDPSYGYNLIIGTKASVGGI